MKNYKQLTILHDDAVYFYLLPSDISDDLLLSFYNVERKRFDRLAASFLKRKNDEFDCSYKIKKVSYKKRKPPKNKVIIHDVKAWINNKWY